MFAKSKTKTKKRLPQLLLAAFPRRLAAPRALAHLHIFRRSTIKTAATFVSDFFDLSPLCRCSSQLMASAVWRGRLSLVYTLVSIRAFIFAYLSQPLDDKKT